MTDLKMYKVDDCGEHHHVIAEDERDAALCVVESGLSDAKTVEEYLQDYEPDFTQREPSETVVISDDDGSKKTRTVAEWIEAEGRGLLASSVF